MSGCTAGGETLCDLPRVICTGVAARWCPICGDCSCPYDEAMGWGPGIFEEPTDDDCPLHGFASDHAEGEHEP